jgi:hypothetical protein
MATFEDHTLNYNGHDLTFLYRIFKIAEVADGCLVMLTWAHQNCSRNVFFVDPEGQIKWQIQRLGDPNCFEEVPYTGFTYASGELRIYNSIGVSCGVDLETGLLTSAKVTK